VGVRNSFIFNEFVFDILQVSSFDISFHNEYHKDLEDKHDRILNLVMDVEGVIGYFDGVSQWGKCGCDFVLINQENWIFNG